MKQPTGKFTIRGLLGLTCCLLLCGILYAGLNPFHIPKNQVWWLAGADGLRFGEHGTVFTSDVFPPSATDARSIEFWAQPRLIKDSNTLLAFYSAANPRQLWLSQSKSDLKIQTQPSSAWRSVRTDRFYIDNAFRDGRNTFWALTFGRSGAAVYRNGVLIRRAPSFRPNGQEISGQLIIANSAIFHESWSGVLKGLAIYDTALGAAQVSRHYTSWKEAGAPDLAAKDTCIALYLFKERTGKIIHNQMGSGNDLYIPRRFVVIRQTLLDPVWRAFNWTSGFWQDTVINVGGFMPFGCFFCAYFAVRGMRSPVLGTVIFGAAVSLFIEFTQSYLPTRDSSMSDVITNVLGSLLGALAYRRMLARTLDGVMLRIVNALNR
jgi:hypothetical protein